MSDVEKLAARLDNGATWGGDWKHEAADFIRAQAAEIERLKAERDEARRRRDEWRKKADGFDAVRKALREKVGAPWPPHLSRVMWAGLAADEKKRADDAEAERDALRAEVERLTRKLASDTDESLWRFWNHKALECIKRATAAEAERDALRVENERLLEALVRLDHLITFPVSTEINPRGYGVRGFNGPDGVLFAAEIVRAALNGEG